MKGWQEEAEEALRRELVRRGEEITQLNARLEITEQALRDALVRNEILEDFIQRVGRITGDAD